MMRKGQMIKKYVILKKKKKSKLTSKCTNIKKIIKRIQPIGWKEKRCNVLSMMFRPNGIGDFYGEKEKKKNN